MVISRSLARGYADRCALRTCVDADSSAGIAWGDSFAMSVAGYTPQTTERPAMPAPGAPRLGEGSMVSNLEPGSSAELACDSFASASPPEVGAYTPSAGCDDSSPSCVGTPCGVARGLAHSRLSTSPPPLDHNFSKGKHKVDSTDSVVSLGLATMSLPVALRS